MYTNHFTKYILLVLALFFSVASNAQCAMCRAALESEEGGVQAQAINDGIVYLMAIPYILAAIVGFVIYKMRFAKKN